MNCPRSGQLMGGTFNTFTTVQLADYRKVSIKRKWYPGILFNLCMPDLPLVIKYSTFEVDVRLEN